jgi:nucleoside-diphosphate-sugar epimerase
VAERLAILGAAGFIGKALRERLADRYALWTMDRKWAEDDDPAPAEQRATFDATDPAALDDWWSEVAAGPMAGVIHLVAHYDFSNRSDPRYGAVETGLVHLLERVGETLPADVPLVYAGSMTTLRPTEPGRALTESSPRWGPWAYPAHKLRCAELLEASDIPHPRCELVLAGVYGEWCELVPLYFQIERARRSGPASWVYPGPVDRGLTYVHREDAAAAFELALSGLRGRAGTHRFLVGEERPMTYAEVHDAARRTFGKGRASFLRVPRAVAKAGAALFQAAGAEPFVRPWMVDFAGEHFEFDLQQVRAGLGWQPQRSLFDEMDSMCRRARDQAEEWRRRNEARPR